jgi:exodeoxyribonuclease VII large subunit
MLPTKAKVYTVSEITRDIKIILENSFGEVWIEGEISNFKAAASGHFYFSLKDNSALLLAAMFLRQNTALEFKLQDGQKVICFGKIDVYGPRGQYQLIVEKIEPKGIGARQLAFQQLKDKLFKEGLFDPAHKKPLPLMPFCVGIVTSSAGAALRDILQILKKGAGCVDVIIRSVRVQGDSSAGEISAAIDDFNRFKKVELIIVSRGGGSAEDLWSFNEEAVARAVYNSQIPIISAVGHQINTTLSDLAADIFVETPSAAAKLIVDKKNALLAEIASLRQELAFSFSEVINCLRNSLIALRHMLKSPYERLLEKEQLLDELSAGLRQHMRQYLNITRERAGSLAQRLEALSPLAVLSRGYSLSILLSDGSVIKDSARVRPGDLIRTSLSEGAFISKVEEVIKDERKTVI